MSRRPSAASLLSRASILSTGAVLVLTCWIGCELDRSGLSSGVMQPAASGGQTPTELGSGGISGGTGGGSSVHFGTGGVGTGGHVTTASGGSGGQTVPETGGTAGVVVIGSGGDGAAGQGTGGVVVVSSGGAGGKVMPGKGGIAGQSSNKGGSAGTRAGGRGGAMSGSGGWGNSGSGGWNWGTGGSGSSLPMCDASIRDKDMCALGSAGCRKTCGVSELGTKACSCTNRQWNCGDCTYPSGDYSCYQLPASGPVPPCPPNTINSMTSCFGDCTICANYTDTSGMPKMGYCACNQDPGDSQRLYHCASTAEWPPQ